MKRACTIAISCALATANAWAAADQPGSTGVSDMTNAVATLPAVIVTAPTQAPTALPDTPVNTGSRLGLSTLDTPASVETVSAAQIVERGDQTVSDAVTRATGFVSQAAPGNGGTALSVRGFSGQESVMTLYDGTRLFPGAGTVTYPFDTWPVERIEVLRGPASVLYGEGGIGGIVNVVPKRAQRDYATTVQAGIGTDGQKRLAIDTTGALGPMLSYRFYLSDNRSNGSVDRDNSHTTALGGSLRLDVDPTLSFTLDYDYGRQKPATYLGVPVVNGALDEALRDKNYNVGDATIGYYDQWVRFAARWQPAAGVTVRNTLYYLSTYRHWRDSESYALNPTTDEVTRSDYIEILHHEQQVGDQFDTTFDGTIAGHANRVVVGTDVNEVTFQRDSNTPFDGSSTVNAFNFDPGRFASPDPTVPEFRTHTFQASVFAEDRLEVTPRLAWVSGLRYDHIDFRREQLATDTSFEKTLANTSWRTGLVFALTPSLSVYGQYTTGTDGVDSLVTLSASDAAFKLSTGRQWEAGVKQDLMNGRGFWTLAVYGIVKNNLLTTDPLNPTVTQQVGQQSSRGIELSGAFQIGAGWAIEANAALLRARFDNFDEVSGDTTVSRAGNVPNGIAEQSANLWLSWACSPAWKIGSGLRYVGRTYGDNANTVPVPSYTVIDASARWQLTHSTSLALYLRNLANRAYALSTTNDGNQWLLGPSRSAELVATTTF